LVTDTADLREAVAIGGRGVATVTTTIRDIHVAIARRAFRLTGPAARPAHLLHDGISRTVYATVGGTARIAATATGIAVAARAATDPSYRPLPDRPRGNAVIGALNGAWGDLLSRTRSPLALPMAVRHEHADVPLTTDGLRQAFPTATGDVAVFVHGLCETDASWRIGATRHHGDPRSTHGSRLAADTGLTPVYLRYNSGLHICDNGEHLDDLLARLVEHWPTPVARLTLIGHSMGGLVIRSAAHRDCSTQARWTPLVKRVVYLGSPHLGAPLEVGAAAAARALRRLPETEPLARALASRSVGIKDLRFGDILADDWAAYDDLDGPRAEPDSCPPLLEGADHFYVGATITRRHDTVAARVLGDALVPFHSAAGEGRARRLGLQVDRGHHLAGLHHFDLLNHPRVYAVLRAWLAG
jgi:hypothetical protein